MNLKPPSWMAVQYYGELIGQAKVLFTTIYTILPAIYRPRQENVTSIGF